MFKLKSGEYVSRSKATVIDNRDPLNKGRIMIKNPIVDETGWIPYLKTPGLFDIPSIGDVVYVEADGGDFYHIVAWGNVIKGEDASPEMPEEFRRDIPTNRGMHTPGGHIVELDDGVATLSNDPVDNNFTTESRGIRITSTAGNKIHIAEDADGGNQSILLEDAGGNKIQLNYKDNKLSVTSIGTTEVDTAEDKTETVGGNLTLTVTGNIAIEASGGAKLTMADGKVAFGAGDELLDLVSQLCAEVSTIADTNSTEIHPTALGPSGPPTTAGVYTASKTAVDTIKGKVDGIKGSL